MIIKSKEMKIKFYAENTKMKKKYKNLMIKIKTLLTKTQKTKINHQILQIKHMEVTKPTLVLNRACLNTTMRIQLAPLEEKTQIKQDPNSSKKLIKWKRL